jgi:CheY-like chemotaxis protein
VERPLIDIDVLVAEDNLTNRLVVGKLLTTWGATVHFAEDGAEALEMIRNGKLTIDAILMDCEMPNMDGYTATIRIRELEAEQSAAPRPIIALTAHALPEFRKRADDAGMTGYVTKPIDREALLSTLLTAVGTTAKARPPHRAAAHRST